MNPSLYSLSATMINQINRVDVLSNNLANINTTGFKEDKLVEGSFNYYLERAKVEGFKTTQYTSIINTVPKIDGSFVNNTNGSIVESGNELDFALNSPDTFFKVQDKQGEILLTRDGSFKNLRGFLVTSDGKQLLNNNNEPIAIENGFEQLLSIVKIDFKDVYKVGANNYKYKNDILEVQHLVNVDNEIIQGATEKSNVNAVSTMVHLIDSQRRLEQAQKAISGLSEISEKILQKIDGR